MPSKGRAYRHIDFPPLTDEQKQELEKLKRMRDEDIDYSDIPPQDFSDAEFYYDINSLRLKSDKY